MERLARDHPGVRPDLAELDAAPDLRQLYTSDDPFDLYLDGINLADAYLDSSRFEQVSIAGADLTNTQLRGASLRYCSLENTNLEGADLPGAELTNIVLSGCRRGRVVCGDKRPARRSDTTADAGRSAGSPSGPPRGSAYDELHRKGTQGRPASSEGLDE